MRTLSGGQARPLSQLRESTDTFACSTTGHAPVARCCLATRLSSSLVKGFPIHILLHIPQPAFLRARGSRRKKGLVTQPDTERTGGLCSRQVVMRWDAVHAVERYRFPRTRLSRWLGPTNIPSSTRRLESISHFFHGGSRTQNLSIKSPALYPTELAPRTEVSSALSF